MNLSLRRVDIKDMPFTTVGYWRYINNNTEGLCVSILILRMSNWKFEASVFIHELVEVLWCIAHNITTEQCDSFDTWYEEKYGISKAPGNDRRCPYHKGHVWGDRFAWVIDKLLHTNIKEYRKEADKLMNI